MKKSTKNILIGSGIVAAGITAVTAASYKLTKNLVKVALDREQPKASQKTEKRLTGSAGQAKQFEEELTVSAEKLKNSECDIVEVTSYDGIKLVGHLRRCKVETL